MSLSLQLQERLQEETSAVMKAAEGLPENERLCAQARELEAHIKTLTARLDRIKEDIRAKCEDGELVGSTDMGYYTLQESKPRESFDWKAAAMDGLFTRKQAERYMKVTPSKPSLVYKSPDRAAATNGATATPQPSTGDTVRIDGEPPR